MSNASIVRAWDAVENDVSDCILTRNPETFLHSCSSFVIPKNHAKYQAFKDYLMNWYADVRKGNSTTINVQGKFDDSDLDPKAWYIIDLRKDKDTTFTNGVMLEKWAQVDTSVRNKTLFDIYDRVKGIVIFADTIEDIPATLWTVSVWSMSSNGCLIAPEDRRPDTSLLHGCLYRGVNTVPLVKTPINKMMC